MSQRTPTLRWRSPANPFIEYVGADSRWAPRVHVLLHDPAVNANNASFELRPGDYWGTAFNTNVRPMMVLIFGP